MPTLYGGNTGNVVTQQTMGLYGGNVTPYPTSAQALITFLANTGNVVFDLTPSNTQITANVTFSQYSNSNVANYLPIYTGNISAGNIDVTGNITGNISLTTNTITATTLNVSGNASLGNLNIVGNLTSVDSIQFDTTAVVSSNPGKIFWDDADGTLAVGLKGGNVILQVGEESVVYARNNQGTAITNGQVVYVDGSQGQRVSVKLANAATESNSTDTLGMLTENIAKNGTGFITTSGLVNGLNTNTDSEGNPTTEGALLFLSGNVAGGWTVNKPIPPKHSVRIGYLVKKSSGNGSIFIKVDNGYELEELHDVLISNVTVGQALVYSTGNLWKNQLVNTLGTLSNISVTGNATIGNVSTGLIGGTLTTAAQPNITSVGTLTSLSVSGNANIGNIGTVGIITATGNITAGNVSGTFLTGTLRTNAQPNITSVGTLTSLSVSGNANVGNIGATNGVFTLVTGTLTSASQPNITSVGTLSSLSVSGNANIGNIGTAGIITATGNITGGNLSGTLVTGTLRTNAQPNITSVGTLTSVSVSGNANIGNIGTAGIITATGNITGGNLSATGNVRGTYLLGDGSLISNISVSAGSQIINGNSNVSVAANGNVSMSVTGTSNVMVVATTGPVVTGNITLTGDARRIVGDFSSANLSNRTNFITSAANSVTLVGIQPNGTSVLSGMVLFNTNTPNVAAQGLLYVNGNAGFVVGTDKAASYGTQIPLLFVTAGVETGRIATDGTVNFGSTGANGDITTTTALNTGIFRTFTGQVTMANNTWVDLFTVPSLTYGTWIVSIGLNASDAPNYSTTSIVVSQTNSMTSAYMIKGTLTAIQTAATRKVQGLQASGASQTVFFTATRVA